MTASPYSFPTTSTTTALPIDLRSITDYSLVTGTPTTVIRQVMCIGDSSSASRVATVQPNGVPLEGNENALVVTLLPNTVDLNDIKELLFQILQQLVRNGVAIGAPPTTNIADQGGQ